MSKPSTSASRPSMEASVYSSLKDAFMRRSSPTKTAAPKATTTKKSPFSIFTSRHKQSASSPAAVPASTPILTAQSTQSLSAARTSKVSSLTTQPPPVPPKSAPASRTTSPIAPAPFAFAGKVRPIPLVPPPSTTARSSNSSERPRPTVPFATSSVLQPTAASSARSRPVISPTSSSSSVTRPTISSSSHKRVLSKSKIEPVPTSPSTVSDSKTSSSRTPTATSHLNEVKPKPPSPDVKITGPMGLRPRTPNRLPTSPPSAFPMRPAPVRSLPRKRSKTFPDPSDPVTPVPPPSLSRSMNTANRILEAFEPSPLMNDAPEKAVQQRQTSPTPPPKSPARAGSTSPVKPIRSPQDPFMSIPSRARSPGSNRIMPSAAAIEATATRQRQPLKVQTVRSPVANSPAGRASFDQSLPPPPRKPVSPTTATSGNGTQSRRLARPPLRPIQTKAVSEPNVIAINKSPSPETPDTQPSSPSPKTPVAPYAETNYFTSDDEGSKKKRGLRSLFNRKRPDSLVSSSSYLSASGTSNASATLSGAASRQHLRQQKGPGTFGGLPEEDEVPTFNTQMRHGIKRHAHPPAEVPYPVSFEEMVLQGEKHTQELLSMVLNQKAYHFTPLDNSSKVKSVLDLGCGRGDWITNAVKEWKNAKFIGFDLVDVFLTPQDMREKRGLQDSQVSRIEFVKGNFFNTLPFPSDHFDFIRLAFLELAVPESKWSALLKEAWRVLRPGGHIEVIIETYLFPTVWSYEKLELQQSLEDEFRRMLDARDIPPPTNIGEKMFFDPFVRVQTHQHVSVCIAPRPAGRSSLDDPTSPRNFGSMRSMHSPWTSEPMVMVDRGVVSPTPYGSRPSLDRSWTSVDVLPPPGQVVTSRTCAIPGIVIYPDTFIPVSEETLFTYASHGAKILNATRLAAFSDKYPDATLDEYEQEWQQHVEQYWQYERSNRLRLGFRMKQFDDDDEDDDLPVPGPTTGRWKWSKCDEDLERPLEIRRFRAWTLTKPGSSR